MLGLGEVKKLQVMKGPQSKLILDIYQTSYYNSKSDKMWSTSFCDLMNHVTDHTGNRNVSVGEENVIRLMEQYLYSVFSGFKFSPIVRLLLP